MNFLSVLYAKAGITVDGITTLNNTATALTPTTSDNSTKIATTAFVKNQNYYPYPTGTTAQYVRGDGSLATFPTIASEAQTLITEVYNETGATLAKGTVVYINGGHGNLPTITKALATGDATSAQTYGVVQNDITDNNNGFVVVSGSLIDLNTNSYAPGTILYLSSTTAGEWTSVKQYAPAHLVYVAIVVRQHPTQGVVEIKIQNGYEMDELHNVAAQSPANGDILQYVSSTSLWTKTAGTTTNIAEGTNLYYTDARSRAAFSETVIGLDYNSTTGVLSIQSGYSIPTNASQTEWDTAYTNRITSATSPLSIASNTISMSAAGISTNGYLTSADWNTFNNKQPAGSYITALTGEATASGPGSAAVTLTNNAVTAKVLTGLNITGGTVNATDSIVTAFGKVQNQLNSLVGGTIYKGVWNASTNSPSLSSGVGTQGWYYIVNVAGSTNLDGITDWNIGDWAIFDGTAWQQVDNTDSVTSVNGFTGAVSLTTSNISEGTNLYYTAARFNSAFATKTTTDLTEGTNLYFTNARAQGAISLTTLGTSGAATYSGGVLNIPQYQAVITDPVTGVGTTNYVAKWTSGSVVGNSIIYDNGTNVGIGTTSPGKRLDVVGTTETSIRVRDTGGASLEFYQQALNSYILATNNLIFYTAGASRLTISTTGAATFSSSVSVGASTNGRLGVRGTTNDSSAYAFEAANSSGNTLFIVRNDGLSYFAGNVGIGTTSPIHALSVVGKIGGNIFGDSYVEFTSAGHTILKANNDVFLGYSQNFVVKQNGNTLIGTTTDSGYKLDVNGNGRVNGSLTFAQAYGLNQFVNGTGDGSSFSTYNFALVGWSSMAFYNPTVGGTYPNQVSGLVDFREGIINMKGGFKVNGSTVLYAGNYSSYALPLSGGTITGDLTVNNKVYVGTNGCYFQEVLIGSVYELQVVDSAGNKTVLS